MNIKCRYSGLTPSAAIIVATGARYPLFTQHVRRWKFLMLHCK